MKPKHLRKALTIGDLITNVYNAYGKRRAKGILQLAFKAQLVVFRARNRHSLSGRNEKSMKALPS